MGHQNAFPSTSHFKALQMMRFHKEIRKGKCKSSRFPFVMVTMPTSLEGTLITALGSFCLVVTRWSKGGSPEHWTSLITSESRCGSSSTITSAKLRRGKKSRYTSPAVHFSCLCSDLILNCRTRNLKTSSSPQHVHRGTLVNHASALTGHVNFCSNSLFLLVSLFYLLTLNSCVMVD